MFIVHTRDGKTINENTADWKEVKSQTNNLADVTSLQLKKGNQFFTVSVDGKNVDLLQLKRNVQNILTGTTSLEERVIGFIIKEGNEQKYAVKMEINEHTGNVYLTLEQKVEGKWKKL